MEEEIKASRRVDSEGEEHPDVDRPDSSEAAAIAELWNEELQRSYQILKAVMGTLPAKHRGQLVDLLETLAKDDAGRKSQSSLESTAEQIVSAICRDDHRPRASVRHEPGRGSDDRRQENRRRNDRRRSERRQ